MKESLFQHYYDKARAEHSAILSWVIAFWSYLQIRIAEDKVTRNGPSDLFS